TSPSFGPMTFDVESKTSSSTTSNLPAVNLHQLLEQLVIDLVPEFLPHELKRLKRRLRLRVRPIRRQRVVHIADRDDAREHIELGESFAARISRAVSVLMMFQDRALRALGEFRVLLHD